MISGILPAVGALVWTLAWLRRGKRGEVEMTIGDKAVLTSPKAIGAIKGMQAQWRFRAQTPNLASSIQFG